MLIVAQKNHHTKIFQANSPDNVPPGLLSLNISILSITTEIKLVYLLHISLCSSGTVIDNGICHPRNNDFYLCAHAGMIVSSFIQLI